MKLSQIQYLAATLLLVSAPFVLGASENTNSNIQTEQQISEEDVDSHLHRAPELSELGGPFTLTDHDGNLVTNENFLGKYAFFYFGYTQCDMACPVALANMVNALKQVDPNAEQVVPVFVDFNNSRLDPPKPRGSFYYQDESEVVEAPEEHQGHGHGGSHMVPPPSLGKEAFSTFMTAVSPNMIGLVGTRAQIWNIMAQFNVRYEHTHIDIPNMDHAGNRIRHTTHMYLLGPDGNMAAVFSAHDSASEIAERLIELLGLDHDVASLAMTLY